MSNKEHEGRKCFQMHGLEIKQSMVGSVESANCGYQGSLGCRK